MASGTVISYPIPAYSNLPIEPQFYQPRRFVISALTLGQTTTVTTSVPHDYVIGQNVRLLIAPIYGSYQLNQVEGYVISIPSTTQVVVNIYSMNANPFIANPYTATITNITQAANAVVTANNSLNPNSLVTIFGVSGMTQINVSNILIVSRTPTTITLNIDSTSFSAYTSGGTVQFQANVITQPQILAIGDINSGVTNTSGRVNNLTYIPGSFINISPQ